MIEIHQCKIPVSEDNESYRLTYIANLLHKEKTDIISLRITKKSLDARKKPNLFYVYSFLVDVAREDTLKRLMAKNKNIVKASKKIKWKKTIHAIGNGETIGIIGAGPAGLFAAYHLALAGYHPLVIERGATVEKRISIIEKFWKDNVLDKNTNVSFGEGGAGTFSDGKLNTAVKDKTGRKQFVLDTFVECGAPDEIRYLAKPHIGTDLLRQVIMNLREKIIKQGGKFYFETKFQKPITNNNQLVAIEVINQEGKETQIPMNKCILALGHSARDTFEMLKEEQIAMEPKAFAVGVRVSHPQDKINESQYGKNDANLPSADYKCTAKASNGRNVYTFCMCPGGYVVNASTEPGCLVINGMSNHDRDGLNANSAVIVGVTPEDFPGDDVLRGIEFQRELEKKAYTLGNGKIPLQRYGDFKKNITTTKLGTFVSETKGETAFSNVRTILPEEVSTAIEDGIEHFAHAIPCFNHEDTLIYGIESRTSSPVRIMRDPGFECSLKGLYPCGEGAGYAGGIMSAAMDGLRVASMIQSKEEESRE